MTKISVCIIIFILGWTAGQLLESVAPYRLTNEINLTDLLSIIIEIVIAVFIVSYVTRSLENNRVEKDHFINVLSQINDLISELEEQCSKQNSLSLHNVTYILDRVRKKYNKLRNNLEQYHKSFYDKNKSDFDDFFSLITILNSQLTDSETFRRDNFEPIKIVRNVIHLNNSVKPAIDKTFDSLKNRIFEIKLRINRM